MSKKAVMFTCNIQNCTNHINTDIEAICQHCKDRLKNELRINLIELPIKNDKVEITIE